MTNARRVGRLVVAIGAAACVVTGLAPAADAGASFPPPTKGYVSFSPGRVTTTCKSGKPVSITYSFHWNARKLTGRYHAVASLTLVTDPHSINKSAEHLIGRAKVRIRRGRTGNFAHTFRLPASSTGDTALLSVDKNYMSNSFDVSCATPKLAAVAPKIRISKLSCSGNLAIRFDNRRSRQKWSPTLLFTRGGFIPGGDDPIPARKVHTWRVQPGKLTSPMWVIIDLSAMTGKYRIDKHGEIHGHPQFFDQNSAAFLMRPAKNCG